MDHSASGGDRCLRSLSRGKFQEIGSTAYLFPRISIIFTGTVPETGLVEAIRRDIKEGAFSLAGNLEIAELSALISIAPLLITNNTGPMHIAAALGIPLVVLYALTNPQYTPWSVPHRILNQDVPCRFCYKSICPMEHHNCLRLAAPEAVVEASLDLLALQTLEK